MALAVCWANLPFAPVSLFDAYILLSNSGKEVVLFGGSGIVILQHSRYGLGIIGLMPQFIATFPLLGSNNCRTREWDLHGIAFTGHKDYKVFIYMGSTFSE